MGRANLIAATQDAFFAALSASTDPAMGPVYENVPQGTQPPFNRVGQIDTDNQAGKAGQLEKLTVEIHSVFRGGERGPLLEQMHAVREALDIEEGMSIASDGVNFSEVTFLSATASDASAVDGLTYAGISVFEVFAEPA